MTKLYHFSLILCVIIAFSACTSTKKVSYFQDLDHTKEISQKIDNYSPSTIQTGDILGINVSSLNPEESARFNNSGVALGGYLVDKNGEVQLPFLSAVKVMGLTTYQIQTNVQQGLTKYLREPIVTVRIQNSKFSVLGDVLHAGVFSTLNDHTTILDALGQAGDLTVTAKRNNILLIREIDGERKFINIDITSKELFNSPYYYLKNNDILYVEAGRAKFDTVNPFNRTLSTILSVLSIGVGIAGIIIITNKN